MRFDAFDEYLMAKTAFCKMIKSIGLMKVSQFVKEPEKAAELLVRFESNPQTNQQDS